MLREIIATQKCHGCRSSFRQVLLGSDSGKQCVNTLTHLVSRAGELVHAIQFCGDSNGGQTTLSHLYTSRSQMLSSLVPACLGGSFSSFVREMRLGCTSSNVLAVVIVIILSNACGKPATVPGSVDRWIDFVLEYVRSFPGLWQVVFASWGSIWNKFCNHFGSLGRVLATLGFLGPPHGGRVAKVIEKVICGFSVDPPPGPPLEIKSAEKHVEEHCAKVQHKRCLRTPSSLQNYGFVYAKPSFSHFHLYLQSNRKWCPMGPSLAPVWVVLGVGTRSMLQKVAHKVRHKRSLGPLQP